MLLHLNVQKVTFGEFDSTAVCAFLTIRCCEHEFCVSSAHCKSSTAFFDQVVHIPIPDDHDAIVRVQLAASLFLQSGIYIQKGAASILLSPLEHGKNKRVSLLSKDFAEYGTIELSSGFYNVPMSSATAVPVEESRRKHIQSDQQFRKEFNFLLSRKRNWGQDRQSSWKGRQESLLATASLHDVEKNAEELPGNSLRGEGGSSKRALPSSSPKLRKTCMSVGYVTFWPSEGEAGLEADKILLKLHLAEQRRLKLLSEAEQRARRRNEADERAAQKARHFAKEQYDSSILKRMLAVKDRELKILRKHVAEMTSPTRPARKPSAEAAENNKRNPAPPPVSSYAAEAKRKMTRRVPINPAAAAAATLRRPSRAAQKSSAPRGKRRASSSEKKKRKKANTAASSKPSRIAMRRRAQQMASRGKDDKRRSESKSDREAAFIRQVLSASRQFRADACGSTSGSSSISNGADEMKSALDEVRLRSAEAKTKFASSTSKGAAMTAAIDRLLSASSARSHSGSDDEQDEEEGNEGRRLSYKQYVPVSAGLRVNKAPPAPPAQQATGNRPSSGVDAVGGGAEEQATTTTAKQRTAGSDHETPMRSAVYTGGADHLNGVSLVRRSGLVSSRDKPRPSAPTAAAESGAAPRSRPRESVLRAGTVSSSSKRKPPLQAVASKGQEGDRSTPKQRRSCGAGSVHSDAALVTLSGGKLPMSSFLRLLSSSSKEPLDAAIFNYFMAECFGVDDPNMYGSTLAELMDSPQQQQQQQRAAALIDEETRGLAGHSEDDNSRPQQEPMPPSGDAAPLGSNIKLQEEKSRVAINEVDRKDSTTSQVGSKDNIPESINVTAQISDATAAVRSLEV